MDDIKNIVEKYGGIIIPVVFLLSQLIGIIIVFRQNQELTLLLIITFIWTIIFFIGIYLFTAKQRRILDNKQLHKYSKRTRIGFLIIFTMLTITIIFVTLLTPSLKEFVTVAISGSPTPTPLLAPRFSPSIDNILIGESENSYMVRVSIRNPLDSDILINHVSISKFDRRPGVLQCSLYPVTIDDTIVITSMTQQDFTFQGTLRESKESSFSYAIEGTFGGCNDTIMRIEFASSFLLEKSSFTELQITLPKQLKILIHSLFTTPVPRQANIYFFDESYLSDLLASDFTVVLNSNEFPEIGYYLNLFDLAPSVVVTHRAQFISNLTLEARHYQMTSTARAATREAAATATALSPGP